MKREILEKPFAPEQIKQRNSSYGRTLDYVEGHTVIQRLNEAFNGAWSFEVLKHEVFKDTNEVIVLGKLTAENVVKMQFGSSEITKAESNGEIISICDDLKAAATDALKKAATLLGIGLHLYNGDRSLHNETEQTKSSDHNMGQSPKGGNVNGRGNGRNGGNGDLPNITEPQRSYIQSLAKALNYTWHQIEEESAKIYGKEVRFLSIKDGSSFIEILKAKTQPTLYN